MLNIDDRLIKEISPKIKPNALSVLLAISIHLNKKNGTCFPSHKRLMTLTGLGRDAVYAAIEVLKKEGLLTVLQQIDSKKKVFGQRTFKVSTKLIHVFIAAEDAEPLPENPHTAEPDTDSPNTEKAETQQLNESFNELTKKELIKLEGLREAKKTTPTLEDFNAAIDDFVEAKKEKAPSIAGGFPKGDCPVCRGRGNDTFGNHCWDCSGTGEEPTHTVTTIEPNNPVTVVEGIAIEPGNPNATQVTITTSMNESGETYLVEHTERVHVPQNATTALFNRMGLAPKATNGDEADAIIVEWAKENLETVKFKYNRAKRTFTPEDLDKLIMKFCGQYASHKDTGTMQRFLFDPARFFNDKLTSWLVDQPGFEKMATKNTNNGKSKSERNHDAVADILRDVAANGLYGNEPTY